MACHHRRCRCRAPSGQIRSERLGDLALAPREDFIDWSPDARAAQLRAGRVQLALAAASGSLGARVRLAQSRDGYGALRSGLEGRHDYRLLRHRVAIVSAVDRATKYTVRARAEETPRRFFNAVACDRAGQRQGVCRARFRGRGPRCRLLIRAALPFLGARPERARQRSGPRRLPEVEQLQHGRRRGGPGAEYRLNSRPRKSIGFRTPEEAFAVARAPLPAAPTAQLTSVSEPERVAGRSSHQRFG